MSDRPIIHSLTHSFDAIRGEAPQWETGELTILDLDVATQRFSPSRDEDMLVLKAIASGSMTIEHNHQIKNFGPGSMILIEPSRDVTEYFLQRTQASTILIPKRVLRDRGICFSLPGFFASDLSVPDVLALRDLAFYVTRHAAATSERMRQRFGEHLLDLMEIFMTSPEIYNHGHSSAAILRRAKRLLGDRLGDVQLSPAQIAAELNISTGYLNRIFKSDGKSVMRYLLSLRLAQAERMLSNTTERKIQIQEIAYQCGFTSAPHFSRVFKNCYGRSPRYSGRETLDKNSPP